MSFVTVARVVELDQAKPLAVDVALSEGDVVGGTIECYLHGSTFDLATGRPLNLPATAPVRVFACRVEGDDVQIDVDAPTPIY